MRFRGGGTPCGNMQAASERLRAASARILRTLAVAGVLAVSFCAVAAAPSANDAIDVHVEHDGMMFTSSTEMTVPATDDEVWAVLTDFDHMAQILSSVDASMITNRNGNSFDVVQKSHAYAGPLRLTLDSVRRVELTPKREIHSQLVKGDLKSSDFVTRIAQDGSLTRISVNGKFVTGGFAAAAVSPELVEKQTRQQYQELRDEILRRQRHEPSPPCIAAKSC